MNSEIGMWGWYKIRNWDMGFVFNQELGCGAGFQSGTEMWSWFSIRNWDVGLVYNQELGCGAGLQSGIGMWGWFTIIVHHCSAKEEESLALLQPWEKFPCSRGRVQLSTGHELELPRRANG